MVPLVARAALVGAHALIGMNSSARMFGKVKKKFKSVHAVAQGPFQDDEALPQTNE
jgi:hypothetical protein